jgi:hypothetical protein
MSPGPWITHCGSRVIVGVKVRVGRDVSVGGRVDVWVGKAAEGVGVTVAGCEAVGKGSRLGIQVGVAVGVGVTTKLNPPHAMRNKASADIPKKSFPVIARKVVFLTKQSREGSNILPYKEIASSFTSVHSSQ